MTEKLDTRCVHAGELVDPHGSPHTPLPGRAGKLPR